MPDSDETTQTVVVPTYINTGAQHWLSTAFFLIAAAVMCGLNLFAVTVLSWWVVVAPALYVLGKRTLFYFGVNIVHRALDEHWKEVSLAHVVEQKIVINNDGDVFAGLKS